VDRGATAERSTGDPTPEKLAFTGADVASLVVLALILCAAGAAVQTIARRRRVGRPGR
jgi:hypothetical protein